MYKKSLKCHPAGSLCGNIVVSMKHIKALVVAKEHACGVIPQSVLTESKVSFAITHSAGHMFMTDLPSDTVL